MPTRREREYYRMGFLDGQRSGQSFEAGIAEERIFEREQLLTRKKPKRKLSAWNKYVKNRRNHIRYRDGKLNLKKMAVAFRKKRRKRRR